MEPARYAQIEATPDGGSRWVDVETPAVSVQGFARDVPPVEVADLGPTAGASLVRAPVGWATTFHPAPRELLIVILQGRVEVTSSVDETRSFGPGELFLARDTIGQGHRTRIVGSEESLTAFITLGS